MTELVHHTLTKKEREAKKAERLAKAEAERLEKVKNLPDNVHGVDLIEIDYTRVTDKVLKEKRHEFTKARKEFLASLAKDQIDVLKVAGLTEKQIELIAKGDCPNGWNVHHKNPLGGCGKNELGNFILIKNDPYHIDFHKFSDIQIKNMREGETRKIKMPMPKGSVFIAPEQEKQNQLVQSAIFNKLVSKSR